jgi:hypothetical protein
MQQVGYSKRLALRNAPGHDALAAYAVVENIGGLEHTYPLPGACERRGKGRARNAAADDHYAVHWQMHWGGRYLDAGSDGLRACRSAMGLRTDVRGLFGG